MRCSCLFSPVLAFCAAFSSQPFCAPFFPRPPSSPGRLAFWGCAVCPLGVGVGPFALLVLALLCWALGVGLWCSLPCRVVVLPLLMPAFLCWPLVLGSGAFPSEPPSCAGLFVLGLSVFGPLALASCAGLWCPLSLFPLGSSLFWFFPFVFPVPCFPFLGLGLGCGPFVFPVPPLPPFGLELGCPAFWGWVGLWAFWVALLALLWGVFVFCLLSMHYF